MLRHLNIAEAIGDFGFHGRAGVGGVRLLYGLTFAAIILVWGAYLLLALISGSAVLFVLALLGGGLAVVLTLIGYRVIAEVAAETHRIGNAVDSLLQHTLRQAGAVPSGQGAASTGHEGTEVPRGSADGVAAAGQTADPSAAPQPEGPGWYPDPFLAGRDGFRRRYFDGSQWTEELD